MSAKRLNGLRRPAFLLSGLLTCGGCGGKYAVVVGDRYGCLGHFRKGSCDNGRTIRRDDIERRILTGLTDKLVSPEAVAAAVRAFAEETNRQNHERRAQAQLDRRTPEKIDRSVKGIMTAIEDGLYQPAMKARMAELEQQKAEIEARLATARRYAGRASQRRRTLPRQGDPLGRNARRAGGERRGARGYPLTGR